MMYIHINPDADQQIQTHSGDFWEKLNYDNWACSPERLSLGRETFLSHTALFAMCSWLFLEASVLSPENRYQPQILPR